MALQKVTFQWDDRFGSCYDCGVPAVYALKEVYGPAKLRCSVCAAQAAIVDGEELIYLPNEEEAHEMVVDATREVSVKTLLDIAAGLVDEPGANPEYERALAELITEAAGLSMDFKYIVGRAFGIREP